MTYSSQEAARRAALRLAEDMGPALPGVVEARLAAGGNERKPPQYGDPATLIAWGNPSRVAAHRGG